MGTINQPVPETVSKKTKTQVRLDQFDNSEYDPGASFLKRTLWYFTNALFFQSAWFPFFSLKRVLLKIFGASIGKGVNFKPRVSIKSPWFLTIGDHVWVGEEVWIDNLCRVVIEDHVCVSQGAMLLTGNHDYKKETFDLITGSITLERGAWVGAKSTVCPGVTVQTHAILTVGSVATQNLEEYGIYQGNPAVLKKKR